MRNVSTPTGTAPLGTARESTQPLLGTFVTIAVRGLETAQAETAIAKGFAAIERVHSLMSFHSADSDLARVNRAVSGRPVRVAPETFAVLELAHTISKVSSGVFDVTVAPLLVARGMLPPPTHTDADVSKTNARAPDPEACWSDVLLEPPDTVRIRRPLWIDLGGIAKGFAVDLAASEMALAETASWQINAGGDLRVGGSTTHLIALKVPELAGPAVTRDTRPFIELENGSLASSAAGETPVHFLGHDHAAAVAPGFVSVVAKQCAIADALTKVVLAKGKQAASVLAAFDASAYFYSPREGWWISGNQFE